MRNSRRSIRWRFSLWLAFLMTCILTGFGFTAFELYKSTRFKNLDPQLHSRVAELSVLLRTPPQPDGTAGRPFEHRFESFPPDEPGPEKGAPRLRPFPNQLPDEFPSPPPDAPGLPPLDGPMPGPKTGPPRDVPNLPDREVVMTPQVAGLFAQSTNDFYFVVWSRLSTVMLQSSNVPPQLHRPVQPGKDTSTFYQTRGDTREAFHFTERGHCVLVGHSISAELAATRQFAVSLVLGWIAILALGIGGAWMLAGRVVEPIRRMSVAAEQMSAGSLSARIDIAEADRELEQLAQALNSAFARLEAAFARQRQFTGDASHELRTPIAVIMSEAQTTLARERTPAEYRETITTCLETAQQMRRTTESLLDLARLDDNTETAACEPVEVAQCAEACVQMLRSLANQRDIRIISEFQPASISGDPVQIKQVVTNLVSNAIQFNRNQGTVRVSVKPENGQVVLQISDDGEGIPAADLPHIFERFYQVDKTRPLAQGHSGLGLAIVKAIVETHQGTIEVASTVGKGSVFTVKLPALQPAGQA